MAETDQQKEKMIDRRATINTTGVGFVKQVGFKPGVKERGSHG